MGRSPFLAYQVERDCHPVIFSSTGVAQPWRSTEVTWESFKTIDAPLPTPRDSDIIGLGVTRPDSTFYIWCICDIHQNHGSSDIIIDPIEA